MLIVQCLIIAITLIRCHPVRLSRAVSPKGAHAHPRIKSPSSLYHQFVITESLGVHANPSFAQRVDDGGGAVIHRELFEDGRDVIFDGLIANL